ncbi:MAG TPA: MFS transporter [Pseudonocardia sp.]|jgi:sugar phosphate permease|uniref:MFS transporter n=1 Tax=Pseudonocardia sp. TaxID=60912 RepID=UPI002F41824F
MVHTADRRRDESLPATTLRKVTRRVIPLLVLAYLVSYLDRINISFAKFGMDETFGMTATQYGFAAGIFFVGYVLAEVPSNIIMTKVGARVWLSRIMLTWGVIAALTAFVPNLEMFYVMRFLLGLAEAGFFPGILVYLTHWYPNRYRPKVVSTVMVAIPLAGVVGGPLNGWILSAMDGVWGLDGWRWVFVVGGLPAVVLGVAFFLTVTDRPPDAHWLTVDQRAWLTATLAEEEAQRAVATPAGHRAALRNKKVLALSMVYFLLQCGAYPLTYWTPSVMKDVSKGLSSIEIGWLSAVPMLLAAVCMYLVGRRVRNEGSSKPTMIALGISVLTFAVTAVSLGSPMLAFVAITLATMAAQTAKPLFWSLPTTFLAGAGAASGLALINSFGNAAGFVSPYAVGWIQQASGGNDGLSMTVMIVANLLAMVVIAGLWLSARRSAAPEVPPRHGVTDAPGAVAAD